MENIQHLLSPVEPEKSWTGIACLEGLSWQNPFLSKQKNSKSWLCKVTSKETARYLDPCPLNRRAAAGGLVKTCMSQSSHAPVLEDWWSGFVLQQQNTNEECDNSAQFQHWSHRDVESLIIFSTSFSWKRSSFLSTFQWIKPLCLSLDRLNRISYHYYHFHLYIL